MEMQLKIGTHDKKGTEIVIAVNENLAPDLYNKIKALSCETAGVTTFITYFYFYPQHSPEESKNTLLAIHAAQFHMNQWLLDNI